jgi:hypothetical protein
MIGIEMMKYEIGMLAAEPHDEIAIDLNEMIRVERQLEAYRLG